MRPENYIIKYLDEIQLMQLASCKDNQPWVVNVYFAVDNQHNFYWTSQNTRRHSQEIADNGKVAAAIHLPYQPGVPGRGVQVQGVARAVPQEEVDQLFQAYAEKFNAHAMLPTLLDEASPHTLYQMKTDSFVLWDEQNFPDNPRQEWTLPTAEN